MSLHVSITVERIIRWVEGRERSSRRVGRLRMRGHPTCTSCISAMRGFMAPHGFVTTVDAAGVRTEILPEADETAVVKKIPASIESAAPSTSWWAGTTGGRRAVHERAGPGETPAARWRFPDQPGEE